MSLSTLPPTCLSAKHLSTQPSDNVAIYLALSLSLCICFSLYPSTYPYISASAYQTIHLATCPSVYLCVKLCSHLSVCLHILDISNLTVSIILPCNRTSCHGSMRFLHSSTSKNVTTPSAFWDSDSQMRFAPQRHDFFPNPPLDRAYFLIIMEHKTIDYPGKRPQTVGGQAHTTQTKTFLSGTRPLANTRSLEKIPKRA